MKHITIEPKKLNLDSGSLYTRHIEGGVLFTSGDFIVKHAATGELYSDFLKKKSAEFNNRIPIDFRQTQDKIDSEEFYIQHISNPDRVVCFQKSWKDSDGNNQFWGHVWEIEAGDEMEIWAKSGKEI